MQVIGLSVDYTIHLGHMYVHAGVEMGYDHRAERAKYSIETMMGTVLGGAITTCGAGCFMFLCVQTFFYKVRRHTPCKIKLLNYHRAYCSHAGIC